VGFLVGDGAMLDASRDDDQFTRADDGFVAAKFHAQRALDDEEQFVFDIMVVPNELALDLHNLHCAIVDFANQALVPVIRERAEFFFEVDGFHLALRS
jgi:hypothetical protein